MENSQKNNICITDSSMHSSKNGFNICGIGAMSTWYLENNSSLNKIEGKLVVFKSCISDVKVTLGNADKDTLMWLIYLLQSNCINSQSKMRHGVLPSELQQYSNKIGLSLVKITKVEDNAVFFEGLEGYMIDQTVVLEIVPFMAEYHNDYNIRGDTNQLQVKSNSPTQQQHNLEVPNFIQNGPQTKHILLKEEDCSETQPEDFSDFEDGTFPDETTLVLNDIAIENQKVLDAELCDKQNSHKKEECFANFTEVPIEEINGSNKKYQCLVCNKFFARNSSLVRHVKIHSKENQYKFSICKKSFASRITLKSHAKMHGRDTVFDCKICKSKFRYASSLRKHVKKKHAKEKIFVHPIFNEMLTNSDDLRKHNEKHEKKFSENSNNISEVIADAINNDKKDFLFKEENVAGQEASQSNISYFDRDQQKTTRKNENVFLKRHIENSLKSVNKNSLCHSFTCDTCLESFSRKSQLIKHIASHKTHKCSICKRSFFNSEDLNIHVLIHNQQFKCDICQRLCYNKSSLTNHKRVHSGEKPYQCSFCGKTFNQVGYFNIHVRWHTGERPYECAHCSYACPSKTGLQTHMRTHTGENPYCCDICGIELRTVSSLARHIRLHTGDRPYKCETCGKAYKTKQQLTIHGYSHTGEKPHVCPLCQSAYVKRGSLKKHMKKNHPGQENALPSKRPKWEKRNV